MLSPTIYFNHVLCNHEGMNQNSKNKRVSAVRKKSTGAPERVDLKILEQKLASRSLSKRDVTWLAEQRIVLSRIISDELKKGYPIIPCYESVRGSQRAIVRKEMQPIEKLVFHYTKLETFRDYIFRNGSIRLSPSESLWDPIEKMWYINDVSGNGLPNQFAKFVKCACFCKPYLEVSPDVKIPGYALARMWDLYGDHYNGVCIGFIKELLEKELEEQYGERHRVDEIRYTINLDPDQFDTLHQFKNDDEFSEIVRSGICSDDRNAKLLKLFMSKQFDLSYRKAIDYRDENELRFSVFQPETGPAYLSKIRKALWMVVLGPGVSDEDALSLVLNTRVKVYRLVFSSPYEFNGDNIHVGFSKGYARLEELSSPAIRLYCLVCDLMDMLLEQPSKDDSSIHTNKSS